MYLLHFIRADFSVAEFVYSLQGMLEGMKGSLPAVLLKLESICPHFMVKIMKFC
jgi:hypothetical protein